MGLPQNAHASGNPLRFGQAFSKKDVLNTLNTKTFTTTPIQVGETILRQPVTYTLGQLLVILLQNRAFCDGKEGTAGYPPHLVKPTMKYNSNYSTILAELGFTENTQDILMAFKPLGLVLPQPDYPKTNQDSYLRGLRFKPEADEIARAWLDFAKKPETAQEKKKTVNFNLSLQNAEKILGSRVIGQDAALKLVATNLRRHYGGAVEPEHPLSFLFTGASGVGKTELSLAIQELLTGNEKNLIKIDMGNIKEKHHLDTWFGSPNGYKDHDTGGALTNPLKKANEHNQKIVVLLDEVEKAHPEAFDRFLGALDKGELVDNDGKYIDIRNVVFVLTTNLGSSEAKLLLEKRGIGFVSPSKDTQKKDAEDARRKAVTDFFRPEALNRIDEVVPFKELSLEEQQQVFDLKLDRYIERFQKGRYQATLNFSNRPQLRDFLMKNLAKTDTDTYDFHSGGRLINKFIDRHLGNPLNEYLLGKNETGKTMPPKAHIEATLGDDDKITFKWLNRKALGKKSPSTQLTVVEHS